MIMDQKKFRTLLKYYLSCMDAEQATQLKLRQNQEYQTFIRPNQGAEERLFSQGLPELQVGLSDSREKKFILERSADGESLVDLHYGFPIFKDEKDMISPLFYVEVAASFAGDQTLRIFPKVKNFSVNRAHFLGRYSAEEIEGICDELEGEFGSFEARLNAARSYIPSFNSLIGTPILFRTNKGGMKDKLRYELLQLFKSDDLLSKQTALKHYVQGSKGAPEIQKKGSPPILEISTLNDQQEDAVRKGLQAPLTVVTGPPGTGKTQVVTALIASAIYNNQTVLFASNNNLPVDGVHQRIGQSMSSVGNWTMRLGNQAKTEECQKNILALLDRLRGVTFNKQDADQETGKFFEIEHKIEQTLAGLEQARALQSKIGELYTKEAALLQKLPEYWDQQFKDKDPTLLTNLRKYKRHSAPGISLLLRRLLQDVDSFRERHNALITSIAGDVDISGMLLTDEDWADALRKARKSAECMSLHQSGALCISQRRQLEAKITKLPSVSDLYKLKKEKTALSQKLLDNKWLENVSANPKDVIEAANNYFKDVGNLSAGRFKRLRKSFDDLKRFFPVWITTNQSANNSFPLQAGLFDLVVIDEAGQCDIPSVLPLLYRAKRAVFIGDPEQFRHITALKDDIEHALAKAMQMEDSIDDWSYIRRSAFDRAFAATDCTAFLKQHYRCHPDVIEFSNYNFYDGKLGHVDKLLCQSLMEAMLMKPRNERAVLS